MPHNPSQQFDPSHLLNILVAVLRTDVPPQAQDDGTGIQRLFEELILSKQHLVQLFDIGPRSDQERRELEGGK